MTQSVPCAEKNPHNIPPEIVKDLPKRSQGGLFWDITLDPKLPGESDHLQPFVSNSKLFIAGSHRSLFQTLSDQPTFDVDSELHLEYGRCRRASCGGFTNSSTVDAERHLRHGKKLKMIQLFHHFFILRPRSGDQGRSLPDGLQVLL